MSVFKFLVVLLGLAYVLICTAMFFFQRSLQYFPVTATAEDVAKVGLADFRGTVAGVEKSLGHFVAPAATPDRVILVFHGNGGNALGRIWLLELFNKAGLSDSTATVLAEYPGYGTRSGDGSPNEGSIMADALATYDAVRAAWPKAKIMVLGESLGTGVAVAVAADREVDRLVLVSPFSSAVDVAAGVYPWLPVRLLMQDTFNSIGRIAALTAPLLVVHGSADEVVPLALGQKLFAAYPGSAKTMKVLPGVNHNDMAMSLIEGRDDGALALFMGSLHGQL